MAYAAIPGVNSYFDKDALLDKQFSDIYQSFRNSYLFVNYYTNIFDIFFMMLHYWI